jgi:hypothetical protein
MTCRYFGCTEKALPDQSRCETHRLRWLPGKPVEPAPMSPWVRKALERSLPPQVPAA